MTDFFSHFHFLRPEWLGLLPGPIVAGMDAAQATTQWRQLRKNY